MKFGALLIAVLCLATSGFAWRFPRPAHHNDDKPELRKSFSMVGKYGTDALPFEVYWHHDGDLAAIYMTINFTDDNGKKENVFFVQVFDLDDDMIYVYYNTSEKERCHAYPVEGEVPKHFWKGYLVDGAGMCGNQRVTWWRGLFNVLYYGYPFDDVRIGVDSTHHPVCISLERSGAKEQGLLGYSEGEPPREKLKPSWVILKCSQGPKYELPSFLKWDAY